MSTGIDLQGLMEGLLIVTLQASLLVPLILLAQWLLRNHLSARWRHAFWWLLVVRLLCPVSLVTPVSIFNLARLDRSLVSKSHIASHGPKAGEITTNNRFLDRASGEIHSPGSAMQPDQS